MRLNSEVESEPSKLREHKVAQRRRERSDIIIQILKIANNGRRKTHIMAKVGLSYAQLKQYLNVLKRGELLSEKSGIWKTTKKGSQIIEACEICHRLAKEIS